MTGFLSEFASEMSYELKVLSVHGSISFEMYYNFASVWA